MLEAIIFDMDGVIIDSEFIDFANQTAFIGSFIDDPQERAQLDTSVLVGKSYQDLYQTIAELIKHRLTLAEIEQQLDKYSAQSVKNLYYPDILRHDIRHILDFATEHHIKVAVASSSRQHHIEHVLNECGIRPHFDLIVSGEHFPRSKPDPAIYNHTVATLQVDKNKVIVIEDSHYGIAAAKSAGLSVIAYEETRLPIDQSSADYCGKDMNAILTIIQCLHQQ
ncbi:HAD-IA family hydrolase [Testudinibacter sp. TR-2022]|uniref:HAD family hydrolase n=1 Tax=Testudinibacter sp. TR-2022 TaxID=2585029 RepID=UPI00111AEBE1|nr:HAD-IA family hydrolase [Testudinibacter sp. TR-2022]TNH04099.1 HAD-IA family hydrolase [Pasteurellaceae bacterium Phil31]TNH09053.1 HAD-IA family hydrolase [Testudinibacter sp. TR-2022]TNH12890.1 HAD-IA family hydrolase [Testudinibacter sp. TR-2022]TNH13106.1 HAD-IA family hydrolase [Testudinibacter sp. TR-2022]TNH18211.1 HAD-IA family hydrolase [Testudinibacter sp. TR-2022]